MKLFKDIEQYLDVRIVMHFHPEDELLKLLLRVESRRAGPPLHPIRPDVDISYHLEAKDVFEFFCATVAMAERSKRKMKARPSELRALQQLERRDNTALCAFSYLTEEAILWILPEYFKAMVSNFDPSDFLGFILLDNLILRPAQGEEFNWNGLGLRLFASSTPNDAEAICTYLKWYDEKFIQKDAYYNHIYRSALDEAVFAWCERAGLPRQ